MAIIGISGKIQSGKDTVGPYLQYLLSEDSKKISYSSWQLQIERWYNYNDWQIKKFADKLKDIVCILLGCTRADLEDNNFKNKELGEEWWYYKDRVRSIIYDYESFKNLDVVKHGSLQLIKLTPRLLLQLLGTEAGRQIIHPNIWVNALMKDYKANNPCRRNSKGDCIESPHCMDWAFSDKIKRPEGIDCNQRYPNWIITDVRFPNEFKAIEDRGGVMIKVERPCSICGLYKGHKMSCPKDELEHESETALDLYKFPFTIYNNGSLQDLYKTVDSIIHLIKSVL